MPITSFSRLPQGNRVAIGIKRGHTHSERIRLRLRLDEFDSTRFELGTILSKIIRLDEKRAHPRRGLCLARITEPKQDFESLILKGDRQKSTLPPIVIGALLETEIVRVEIQRLVLIRNEHRYVHDSAEHLCSPMLVRKRRHFNILTIQQPQM